MILGLAIFAAAITNATPNVDLAHNKQFSLVMSPQIFGNIRDEENGCTRNGQYCVRLTRENGARYYEIIVFEKTQTGAQVIFQEKIETEIANPQMSLWPNLVMLDWREEGQNTPNFIVGVNETESQMYAGRGLNLSALRLFEIRTTEIKVPMAELLNVAISGQNNIRTCFGGENAIGKDEFCADEYHFRATLVIDPTYGSRYPRFVYERNSMILPWSQRQEFETQARSFDNPNFQKYRDDNCKFARTLTYSRQTSQYEFSQEPPACSEYTDE